MIFILTTISFPKHAAHDILHTPPCLWLSAHNILPKMNFPCYPAWIILSAKFYPRRSTRDNLPTTFCHNIFLSTNWRQHPARDILIKVCSFIWIKNRRLTLPYFCYTSTTRWHTLLHADITCHTLSHSCQTQTTRCLVITLPMPHATILLPHPSYTLPHPSHIMFLCSHIIST